MNDWLITALAVMFLSLVAFSFIFLIGFLVYHGIAAAKEKRRLKRRSHLKVVK